MTAPATMLLGRSDVRVSRPGMGADVAVGGTLHVEPLLNLLAEIGVTKGRSVPEVALRWLLEDPLVLPIPGAKNAAQARTNAGALVFSLSADGRRALSDASALALGNR